MNIIAFFAHPDDETMLCGGTLALLARSGASVDYLCATRGEGGESGAPPLCSREDLGAFRQVELEKAVAALGGRSLTILDYIDPTVGAGDQLFPYTQDVDQLVREITHNIRRLNPSAIITHGSNGEYGHPAHLLTYQAARQAVNSLGEDAPLLYTVQATFPGHPKPRLANKDDPAHLIIDISAVIEMKIDAAMCHRTQHVLFVRRGSQQAGRPLTVAETITKVESLHRVTPAVNGRIDDPLIRMLISTGSVIIPDEFSR